MQHMYLNGSESMQVMEATHDGLVCSISPEHHSCSANLKHGFDTIFDLLSDGAYTTSENQISSSKG